jgi:hypothetical protein
MKKSELKQIIREEIKKLNEEFQFKKFTHKYADDNKFVDGWFIDDEEMEEYRESLINQAKKSNDLVYKFFAIDKFNDYAQEGWVRATSPTIASKLFKDAVSKEGWHSNEYKIKKSKWTFGDPVGEFVDDDDFIFPDERKVSLMKPTQMFNIDELN